MKQPSLPINVTALTTPSAPRQTRVGRHHAAVTSRDNGRNG